MYAQTRILESLQGWKDKHGWMPEYHSVDDVVRFNRRMESVFAVEQLGGHRMTVEPKRTLSRQEKRWILNELALCWADANYWLTRYAIVVDETNNVFPYVPRKSQDAFVSVIAEFDRKQVAIELLCLKARQQGISTVTALLFLHRLLFIPRVQAIMASCLEEKSYLVQRMMNTCIDKLPFWMVPNVKSFRQGGILEFHSGSILSIQSGAQKTGIAQGWTPALIHLSECCDYPKPEETIEVGLMRATHPSPWLFSVYESTGNGNEGWWADTWRATKELWPKGRARLFPLFIPWHMASDLYPKADWLKKFPVPNDWQPCRETTAHATKCELYVRETEVLRNILGKDWRLPRHQQWFWEFNFKEAEAKHTARLWLQQMPADDFEALTGKDIPVFGLETIEVISRDRAPYEVYGFTGEGIAEETEPDTEFIDYKKDRIRIHWETPRSTTLEWVLIGLKDIQEYDRASAMGRLLVFEQPIKGCSYSIGIDTAEGKGQDQTVISVTRCGGETEPDVQVAEFASDQVDSIEAVTYAACIGAWYGPACPRGVPKFIAEQVRRPGDTCQLSLKKMGFFHHHNMIRYDGKRVRENAGHKDGWYTSEWSRPILLDNFVHAVENYWYKPNSPFLIEEIKGLRLKKKSNDKTTMDHTKHGKSDRIFAAAMSYFTSHHLEVMIERSKKKYDMNNGGGNLPPNDNGWHNPFGGMTA